MLNKLFRPDSICLVGASEDKNKIGGVILGNLLKSGYSGKIFPVNPYRSEILGVKCYPDIKSVREDIDLCVISIPAKISVPVVQSAVDLRIPFIVLIPGGFAEAGEYGKMLQNQIKSLVNGTGTRVIGPNTVGIYVPGSRVNTTLTPSERLQFPQEGSIAYISQSGALGLLTLDTLSELDWHTLIHKRGKPIRS